MESIPRHILQGRSLKRQGFDIIPLKADLKKDYDGVTPHRHNFYELLVFTEGGGVHEIDFTEYPIEKHSVHFVSPEQVHRLKSKAANGYVFCFTEEFISLDEKHNFSGIYGFYDFNSYAPLLKLPESTFREIKSIILLLINHHSSDSVLGDEIARCYFSALLLKIKEYFLLHPNVSNNRNSGLHAKIIEFKKLINSRYTSFVSAADYAESLNITPNYLNSLCKKETGKTALELIHERTLLEAKRLLYSTRLSVKEISFSLSFEDVAYFNRFFKKNLGITPTEYREQFINN